jgi:hypothetical protein
MWKSKIKLGEGETIRLDNKHTKGNLGQEEVEIYSIINAVGGVVGSVQYIDHTSIKAPFRNSHHLVQLMSDGQVTVNERWN